MLKICNREDIENIIKTSVDGNNTKFLKSAHNLWIRFKNYDKQPPYVLYHNDLPVAAVFATFSKRTSYVNLYEIVTFQGMEGKGYASHLWNIVMTHAYNENMRRLKISCTPFSIGWHVKNGLVFWAVDSSGSLKSDQPLFANREKQLAFRANAVEDPKIALPTDSKVIEQLQKESLEFHKFGIIKTERVTESIKIVQPYWFREHLFNVPNLMDF